MTSFERKTEPLLHRSLFIRRVTRYSIFSMGLLLVSLGIGVLGYHYLNNLSWIDAILNASMILTGMGPVDAVQSDAAKWFASAYALFSGVAFLSIVAVFFAPMIHRFLHKLHLDETEKKDMPKKSGRK